jgi:chitodextrinase
VVDGSGFDGPESYQVSVVATDGTAASSTQSFSIDVANAAPTMEITMLDGGLDRIGVVGLPVDLVATFADVGPLDTHTASVDWDDGSPLETFGDVVVASPLAATHVYSTAGERTVSVTVTDDDGDAGTASATIVVHDAAGAMGSVIDRLDGLIATSSGSVTTWLREARDRLDGNNRGLANNGALDLVAADQLRAAVVMLDKALAALEAAKMSGGVDLDEVIQLVTMARQSIVQQLAAAG